MKFVVFAVALLAALSPLKAEEVTLNKNEGLASAIKRGGCKPGWLAETMRLNDIQPWNLKKLSRGATITLPDGCDEKAPRGKVRETAEVIAVAKTLQQAGQLEGQLGEAKTTIGQLQTQLVDLERDSSTLVDTLNGRLLALQKQLDVALARSSVPSSRRNIYIAGTSGFLLAALLCGILFMRWRQGVDISPHEVAERYEGLSYVFPLTPQVATYSCSIPGCRQQKLTRKNLRRHLNDAHPELRLEIINGRAPSQKPFFANI